MEIKFRIFCLLWLLISFISCKQEETSFNDSELEVLNYIDNSIQVKSEYENQLLNKKIASLSNDSVKYSKLKQLDREYEIFDSTLFDIRLRILNKTGGFKNGDAMQRFVGSNDNITSLLNFTNSQVTLKAIAWQRRVINIC